MSYLEEFRAAIKAGVSDDEKNAILARAVEDLGGRLEALTREVAPPDYPLLLALLRVTVERANIERQPRRPKSKAAA